MSCNLVGGITLTCRDNAGGVKNAWITDWDNVTSISATTGDTIVQISGTGTWYEFQLIRTTSEMVETVNASLENGTVYYQQDLTMFFAKLEQYKRNILKTLAQSIRLAVVIETNNGSYFLLGQTYGCFVASGSNTTGKALGDATGYTLTLQGLEPNPMNELSASLASITVGMTVEG